MIHIENLTKTFQLGGTDVHALNGATFTIDAGEIVAIMGPSGSGKSTLMSILGCLDVPSTGSYSLDGVSIENMDDSQLAEIRSRKIGFVFQQFNLLARTSALENVMLPLTYAGVRGKDKQERAFQVLERVGLSDRVHHAPNELSGGQQQRVAIARALVNEPAILLADEPTGMLDSKTGVEILDLFQNLHSENGQIVLLVTHDPFVARHTERIIKLSDGKILSDEINHHPIRAGTPRPEEVI
jgi:putative ABC transport system ATP-binding protein